jgi:hypothetical protein
MLIFGVLHVPDSLYYIYAIPGGLACARISTERRIENPRVTGSSPVPGMGLG